MVLYGLVQPGHARSRARGRGLVHDHLVRHDPAPPTSSSDRRTDRQVHAELERRLEAHLLIARRIHPVR